MLTGGLGLKVSVRLCTFTRLQIVGKPNLANSSQCNHRLVNTNKLIHRSVANRYTQLLLHLQYNPISSGRVFTQHYWREAKLSRKIPFHVWYSSWMDFNWTPFSPYMPCPLKRRFSSDHWLIWPPSISAINQTVYSKYGYSIAQNAA
jgi:hypothetical protein